MIPTGSQPKVPTNCHDLLASPLGSAPSGTNLSVAEGGHVSSGDYPPEMTSSGSRSTRRKSITQMGVIANREQSWEESGVLFRKGAQNTRLTGCRHRFRY